MGPYQPILSKYPPTKQGAQNRRFQSHWFKQFSWLEYSPSKDAAHCFPCFLFEYKKTNLCAFTIDGFNSWKRVNDGERCSFLIHVGGTNSPHKNAVSSIDDLKNIPRHIDKIIGEQSLEEKQQNRLRLKATVESIQWLSLQACAFRGYYESTSSNNQGNLIEMVRLLGRMNDDIANVVLEKAPQSAKYTSPKIQKDVGDAKYCILVNETKDISNKEQMALVLRFVDVNGFVRERFFDMCMSPTLLQQHLKERYLKSLVDMI